MKKYSVAIVGAGPAGSTLARELAKASPSLKIILIDPPSENKGKVCGGLLSPDAQRIMASLGMTLPREVLSEEQIFGVDTVDLGRGLHRLYPRNYLNMDRYAFDRYLVSLLPPSVEVVRGKCTGIEREEGGFLLKLNLKDGEEKIMVERLVGADGSASLVRRTLFKDRIERSVAYQEWYLTEKEDNVPDYSCIFDRKTSRHCSWTVRKGKYLILGGVFDKEGFREAFAEQRERLLSFFGATLPAAAFSESCFVSRVRRPRDIILGDARGVFLVGEAAGFISPSSYEGIGNAMESALSLARALADEYSPKKALKRYKRLTAGQRRAVLLKTFKRRLLFTPVTRRLIMRSGVTSVKHR